MNQGTSDIRGSVWRKWDLHLHAPKTRNTNYKGTEDEAWKSFFEALEREEVVAAGITDYFSVDGYRKAVAKKEALGSGVLLLPNIELRIGQKNKDDEFLNIHVLFSHRVPIDRIESFLGRLPLISTDDGNRTGKYCTRDDLSELGHDRAMVELTALTSGLQRDFLPGEEYLLVGVARGYGCHRPAHGDGRGAEYAKEIDKACHAFFGDGRDVEFFLNKEPGRDKHQLPPKPVLFASDAHDVTALGQKFTWIKADADYEGLRQVLCEPGSRVRICSERPDEKDDYKVISKITFEGSADFPAEIQFNPNLCSVIGSRSSGKSALLAYIAHAIDPEHAEKLKPNGPGEGADYSWNNVGLDHTVEWANGMTNDDSSGRVVYVPQGWLFQHGADPETVKDKIKPVLFKVVPDFQKKYVSVRAKIDEHNTRIRETVVKWFKLSARFDDDTEALRDLGDKKAIEAEQARVQAKIDSLREQTELSEEELELYQKVSAEVAKRETQASEIGHELGDLADVSEGAGFFNSLQLTTSPRLDALPDSTREAAAAWVRTKEAELLREVNSLVLGYKAELKKRGDNLAMQLAETKKANATLIKKHEGNIELSNLLEKLKELTRTLDTIGKKTEARDAVRRKRQNAAEQIRSDVEVRTRDVKSISGPAGALDEGDIHSIAFGVEAGLGDRVRQLETMVNTRSRGPFVEDGKLKLQDARSDPGKFLEALYDGSQKLIAGNKARDVATEVLTATEKLLFTAEMEGDKIGGFSESTMTPGKRALFTLRLILVESEDTWPLLIDQPEDDLDSRSIYDEVVPFLRRKKSERQIVMVSHNANLVLGADSEQVIVANRNGDDRPNEDGRQFNYLTGSIENSAPFDDTCQDTLGSRGIREHACAILDGGEAAFEKRRNKYNITDR